MRKILPRLCTFAIGTPLVIGLVYLDVMHHLPLHILLAVCSLLGANELHRIFSSSFATQPKTLVIAMSLLPTLLASACAIFGLNESLINYAFMGAIMVCMAWEVIVSKTFENSNGSMVTSVFTVLYCGFFVAFIARMTTVENSRVIIAVYLLMVFMCDSMAWFFGNLFGKNNKGFIKASPNKSIAGFLGGFFGSVCVGLVAHFLRPDVFGGRTVCVVLLGLLTAFAAIIGDLVESVLKRSSGIKDSGHLSPGRGGMLDSLDSIVFAAPIFYLSYRMIF